MNVDRQDVFASSSPSVIKWAISVRFQFSERDPAFEIAISCGRDGREVGSILSILCRAGSWGRRSGGDGESGGQGDPRGLRGDR